jgi:hypothetical protein
LVVNTKGIEIIESRNKPLHIKSLSIRVLKARIKIPRQVTNIKKLYITFSDITPRQRGKPGHPPRNLIVGQPGDEDEAIQTRTLCHNLNDFGGQCIKYRNSWTQASVHPHATNY